VGTQGGYGALERGLYQLIFALG